MSILRDNWTANVDDYPISCSWANKINTLMVSDVSGGIFAFDGESGNVIWESTNNHDNALLTTSLNYLDDLLASSGQDGKILIWDIKEGNIFSEVNLDDGWIEHLSWSPNGELLAASCSRNAYIFDKHGVQKWKSESHGSTISAIAWSNSDELATACYGKVSFFNIASNAVVQKLEWQGSLVSMELSQDGDIVACGSQDNTVHFWRRSSGQDSMMSGYPGKPSSLAFDSTGKLLATSGSSVITVWSFNDGGPEGTRPGQLEHHTEFISSLAFAPKGNRLASGSRDGSVAVWGLTNNGHGKMIGSTLAADQVTNIAWSKDSRKLAATDSQGNVKTWRLKS